MRDAIDLFKLGITNLLTKKVKRILTPDIPSSEQISLETERPLVFISYATPDRLRVSNFELKIGSQNIETWMDYKKILGGQNWDFEIKKALKKATIVVAFFSKNSVDRRGYVQRELKLALDAMEEKLIDDIFLIPIRLDKDVTIPEQLKNLHVIDADEENSSDKIVDAIRHQLSRLGKQITITQSESGIEWHRHAYKDSWDGAPGYEIEFNWFSIASEKYHRVGEICEIVKGHLLETAAQFRSNKLEPQGKFINFGDSKFSRTDTWDAYCTSPTIVGRMLSVCYSVSWYGAGAAHPNHGWLTYNFLLEPIVPIASPSALFENAEIAFVRLQMEVRRLLRSEKVKRFEGKDDFDKEWIERGTADWNDFNAFILQEDGIKFLFAPYQVGSYAEGSYDVVLKFELIVDCIKSVYVSALDLRY